MKNSKRQLVIDVNIWISCLISQALRRRIDRIVASDVSLLCSFELLEELRRTAAHPKFLRYFVPDETEQLIQDFSPKMEMIPVQSIIEICRDPKDNFLLALAKDGNADYLITGDDDLLTLKQYGKTKIVTITELNLKTPFSRNTAGVGRKKNCDGIAKK